MPTIPPPFLYKYMDIKGAILTLQSRKFLWSSPIRFNDPFDAQWDPLWFTGEPDFVSVAWEHRERDLLGPIDWKSLRISPKRLKLLRDERMTLAGFPDHERQQAVDLMRRDFSQRLAQGFGGLKSQMHHLIRTYRVLSLSEQRTNVLMWSHYSDKHRGVVFKVDTSRLLSYRTALFEKVQYTDELPRLCSNEQAIELLNRDVQLPLPANPAVVMIGTKARHWCYENEWRSVLINNKTNKDDFDCMPFGDGCIVEIALGCKSNADDEASVRRVAGAACPGAPVKKAGMSRNKFAVEY